MSIHDGHRQRLKDRFLKEGLDNFEQIQVLELLLFYCIPRQDTNPIAHALLNRFGSLAEVLEAPVSELKKVPGVGANTATFLSLVLSAGRYYRTNPSNKARYINTVEDYGSQLAERLQGRRNETVYLLCMDAKCKMLACDMVGEGSVNSASVPIRRVVEMALANNATSVVIAHNHPSGFAVPSEEDIRTTYRLAVALQAVEIQLVDHVVVADRDYVSMAQSRCYNPKEVRLAY